jgi:hypothetical protein
VVRVLLSKKANPDHYKHDSGAWPVRHLAALESMLESILVRIDTRVANALAHTRSLAHLNNCTCILARAHSHVHLHVLLSAHVLPCDTSLRASKCSPLWVAAENGHTDVVNCLIEAGASVDQSDFQGVTPLYIASQGGQIDAVAALLHGPCLRPLLHSLSCASS